MDALLYAESWKDEGFGVMEISLSSGSPLQRPVTSSPIALLLLFRDNPVEPMPSEVADKRENTLSFRMNVESGTSSFGAPTVAAGGCAAPPADVLSILLPGLHCVLLP